MSIHRNEVDWDVLAKKGEHKMFSISLIEETTFRADYTNLEMSLEIFGKEYIGNRYLTLSIFVSCVRRWI